MSRTKTPASLADQLYESTAKDREHALARIARVLEIRRSFAPAIIAMGVFDGADAFIDEAISIVLQTCFADANAYETALQTFIKNAVDAGLTREVPVTKRDGSIESEFVEDLPGSFTGAHAEAGFLLGLAVGMQLGPHAFDSTGVQR